MKTLGIIVVSVGISAVALGGCTPQTGVSSFSQNEAGQVAQVQFGQVTAIRQVDIQPGQTRLGTAVGGSLGAIGGSQIGSSTAANIAGGVTGAVVGGAVGSAIQGSSRTAGIEITIHLDSGDDVAVVQPGDPRDFRVGDRVRLSGTSENARVTH